jgi:hypothetical protein
MSDESLVARVQAARERLRATDPGRFGHGYPATKGFRRPGLADRARSSARRLARRLSASGRLRLALIRYPRIHRLAAKVYRRLLGGA